MASVQDEYIHPVIAAMQNAYQIIEHGKQQKFQNELDQKESDLKQASFQEAQKQHDREQSNADRQFSINQALLEIQRQQHSLDAAKGVQQLIAGGATPQSDVTSIPTAPPGSGVPTLDVQNPNSAHFSMLPDMHFNPQDYATPEKLTQLAVDHAKAVKTGELNAEEPFKIAAEGRVDDKQAKGEALRFNRELGVHNADRQSQERIATQRTDTERYIAELNARTRMNLMKGGLDGSDPAVENYVNDMYVTGNQDKIPTNIKVQGAIRGSVPKGWTPLSKTDATQIDGIPLVKNLIDKANQLADLTSGIGGKTKQFLGIGEAGNVSGELDGMMGNLARIFGGERGVLTERDINRAKGLVNSIRQGGSGNKQKVQDLQDLFSQKINELAAKYPEAQRQAIFSNRNIDISQFKGNSGAQNFRDKYGY